MGFKIIGFGNLSIQLIFLFFVSLSRNIKSVVFNVLDIASRLKNFPFLISIFMSFSQILGGLLEFIVCLNEKKAEENHRDKSLDSKISTTALFDKIGLKENKPNQLTLKTASIFLLITVFSIIENDLILVFNLYVSKDITNLRYQLKIINIFFIAFISIYILHYNLFRHQYCSIAIIVIGLFFMLFQSLQYYEVNWYFIIALTICYSLVSIGDVCEKYLMHYKYFSPYRILLYEGALGLVISIIIEIVISFIPCRIDWLCEGRPSIENPLSLFGSFDLKAGLYIIFYVLFVGNLNLWSILTNKYFTPTHLVISDIFSAFLYWAMNFYYQKEPPFPIEFVAMSVIGFIITMFGAFMFTEIIILHPCGLGYYTKVEIQKRCKRNYEETAELNLLEDRSLNIDLTIN